jgi:hypothetical protein
MVDLCPHDSKPNLLPTIHSELSESTSLVSARKQINKVESKKFEIAPISVISAARSKNCQSLGEPLTERQRTITTIIDNERVNGAK